MEEKRANPDEILKKILLEETEEKNEAGAAFHKGKLKIFLGLAAGVGKTYRMLVRSHALKEHGTDYVVGVVETHGRLETEALLRGLEIAPRKKIEYAGLTLEEMDIDWIIARKPEIVLVDEFAHTNAPGSRHEKRYQDVMELLNEGIDVWTTLNVQHIESFNDIVFQVTGIKVNETVPDQILELAHTPEGIELVDLAPDDLMQRLSEGKVYVPEKSKIAAEKFFRKGNLLALREMALRYTARLVDEDIRIYMQKQGIPGPWSASPRLLACVSPDKSSEKVIRLAKQIAPGIDAEWFALHVEGQNDAELTKEASEILSSNMNLVTELGGKAVELIGTNIADEIVDFAKKNNIVIILVGHNPRRSLRTGRTLLDELIKKARDVNVLIVTDSEHVHYQKLVKNPMSITFRKALYSITATLGVGIICYFLFTELHFANTAMLMLMPVIASSLIWGRLSGILSTLLGVALLEIVFIPPSFSLSIADLRYLPSLFVYVAIGVASALLSELIRWQGKRAKQRERFVESLYKFSSEMLSMTSEKEVAAKSIIELSKVFEAETVFFSEADYNLKLLAKSEKAEMTGNEMIIAKWSLTHKKKAGRFFETFTDAAYSFFPIYPNNSRNYIIGFKFNNSITSQQTKLLDSFLNIVSQTLSKMV